jgi:hypothetical protein
MQLNAGPPLVGGPIPNELWPGGKRRPYTPFGDRRHHS